MGRTQYPNAIDSDLEIPRVDDNITEIGGDAINAIRDAIFAIERELGLNPRGNLADVATRLNAITDANGSIKASALEEHGLITLPITDNHIANTAAIQESKLDLDYETSYLNGKIEANTMDLEDIRNYLSNFNGQLLAHIAGTSNRHTGKQIDLTAAIQSAGNVEDAIGELNTLITTHIASTTAHDAEHIVVSATFDNYSASNVEEALYELDNMGTVFLQEHQDRLHTNGIAANRSAEQGDYGNLVGTTAATTIYQTDTSKATNILQVMRPNVARVVGGVPYLRDLASGSKYYLRIQAGGVSRGVLDVNLASVLPTTDMDDIVYAINVAAHRGTNHYPISAYNVDGRLCIAHSMPGYGFTIQILDTVSFSAASELGFGDVIGTTFSWSGNYHGLYLGGEKITDFKALLNIHHTHSGTLNIIEPGLGDLSDYGITTTNAGRVLCNITNHDTDDTANGTYYVLGYPDTESFIISEDIPAGTFDLEIVADSVNFINSANGELYDVFVEDVVDGYASVVKQSRMTYGVISGLDIKSITQDFPTSGMEWQVIDSAWVVLHQGDSTGQRVEIPTGFVGQIQLMAPDGVNSMLVEVTGAPQTIRKTITVQDFYGDQSNIYLGSVHYAGNNGLTVANYPIDKRVIGTTVENKYNDYLSYGDLQEALKELRNNGIISGFDVMSNTADSFTIRGGKALVEGRIIEVKTQDVTVTDFSASTKLAVLNASGDIIVKDEFDAGYSFDELTEGDAYGDVRDVATICQFVTDGSAIDGYFVDRRLMVNKIDKRVLNHVSSLENKILQIRNSMDGGLWGNSILESANVDGYLANIEIADSMGLSYMPYETESASGFLGGHSTTTTRRFQFSYTPFTRRLVYNALGLTHLNIFVEVDYTGSDGGPFGASGEAFVELGVFLEWGESNTYSSEYYGRIKEISNGVFSSNSQVERYIVSIPMSAFDVPDNIVFNITPRVKIVNSHHIDGGATGDDEPEIRFNYLRVVTSSYSVAGYIEEVDGSSSAITAVVSDIMVRYLPEASAGFFFNADSDTGMGNPASDTIGFYTGGDLIVTIDESGMIVYGDVTAETFISTVTTGTAPFSVSSTTLVTDLNADLLDGEHGSYYLDSDNFTGTEWTDLTDSGATTLHKHSHTILDDIGTYTHTNIDTHIDDATIHFTVASIDHNALANLPVGDTHCFSDDTELLTKRGFVDYKYIQYDDEALTLNLKTGELEYQNIQGKYVYDTFDEIVRFSNKGREILVTREHRMIYLTKGGNFKECTAEEAVNRSAIDVPLTGLPEVQKYQIPFSNKFAELLGIIISEGHFLNPKRNGYGIMIYQKEGIQADYIESLLNDLDIPFTRRVGQTVIFYIRSSWARKNIRCWLQTKDISKQLMDLRGEQFFYFLSGLIFGDGSVRKREKGGTDKIGAIKLLQSGNFGKYLFAYHSADKSLIDNLSHLCMLNGIATYSYWRNAGFKNGAWCLNIKKSNHTIFKNKEIIPYSGNVWCVSVPNSTLVLRRNGVVFIAGNSQYVFWNGRTGGQTIYGDSDAVGDLTLSSTSNATKGTINLGSTLYVDENNSRVGIGISSPSQNLDIRGNNYPTINIESSDTSGGDLILKSTSGWYDIYMESNDLRFWDGSTDRVTFKNGGNVGIGTTTPATLLNLSSSSDTELQIESADNSASAMVNLVTKYNAGVSLGAGTALGWSITAKGFSDSTDPSDLTFRYWDSSIWNEVLTLDALTSRVGIGTNSPSSLLEVVGGNANTQITIDCGSTSYVPALYFNQGNSNKAVIDVENTTSNFRIWTNDGGLRQIYEVTNAGTQHDWMIQGSSKMTLDSSGYVGIGTTTPATKLQVQDGEIRITQASNQEIQFYNGSDNGWRWKSDTTIGTINLDYTTDSFSTVDITPVIFNTTGQILANVSIGEATPPYSFYGDLNTGMFRGGADVLGFSTDGTERVRINADGYVGLGTSVEPLFPVVNLHISDINDNCVLQLDSNPADTGRSLINLMSEIDGLEIGTANNRGWQIGAYGHAYSTSDEQNDFFIRYWNSTTWVYAMRIDSSGNVGIGTASPGGQLHIVDGTATGQSPGTANALVVDTTTNNDGITILSNNSTAGYLVFGDTDDNFVGSLYYNHSDDSMKFYVNNDTRMTIDSSGNVGIGDTSMTQKLEVASNTDVSALIGRAYIGYDGTNADRASFGHLDSMSSTGYALQQLNAGTTLLNAASGQDIKFRIAQVDKMILDSAGNVGIGTASPGAKLEIETESNEGHEAVIIDQDDADQAFVDFQGTTGANATNSISTYTSGNSVQGFIQIEINGTKRWIAYYDDPTS